MTSHQVTTFPATDDGETSTSTSTTVDAAAATRTRRVPTSLHVTGVVDPSPRQRSTVDQVEGPASSTAADDDQTSPSGSEAEDSEDDNSPSASPLTLDLPNCFDVPSRTEEGSRLLNSARYRRLVHPLDRGMLLSFAVSVLYLAAAMAAACPTLVLVCVVLPLAVAVRRVVAWCCGGGAPVEAYDDFGMRMFDATPLSGHEQFWMSHRDAVTQCLVTFDGHIGVDRMRQLVEERLLIDGQSTHTDI